MDGSEIEELFRRAFEGNVEERKNLLNEIVDVLIEDQETLSHFFPKLLSFQSDSSNLIRIQLIIALEAISKIYPIYLETSWNYFNKSFSTEEDKSVLNQLLLSCCNLLRISLEFIKNHSNEKLWKELKGGRENIEKWLKSIASLSRDASNNLLFSFGFKWMELFIVHLSLPERESNDNSENLQNFLTSIPPQHPFLSASTCQKESESSLQFLLSISLSSLSSSNLIVMMNSTILMAKHRHSFLPQILAWFSSLFKKTQSISFPSALVPSINHSMKQFVLQMLRIKSGAVLGWSDHLVDIASMLGEGDKANSLYKQLKNSVDPSKRIQIDSFEPPLKKMKESQQIQPINPATVEWAKGVTSILINSQFNLELLVDLIFQSVNDSNIQLQSDSSLEIPSHILPTAAANYFLQSTDVQSNHSINERIPSSSIPTIQNGGIKVPRLNSQEREMLFRLTFEEILKAEDGAKTGGKLNLRNQILSNLAVNLELDHPNNRRLLNHVLEEFETRKGLALDWLFKEMIKHDEGERYSIIFTRILRGLKDQLDAKDHLFCVFLLESPSLPNSAFEVLHEYLVDHNRIGLALSTLTEIIFQRPNYRSNAVSILLSFTVHSDDEIRNKSINVAIDLMDAEDQLLNEEIQEFAQKSITELNDNSSNEMSDDIPKDNSLSERDIKRKLQFYLTLCIKNQSLLKGLADAYIQMSNPVKRVLHELSNSIVPKIGSDSLQMQQLIKEFPKKSEPLILVFLKILTEKNVSPAIVSAVKSVYPKKVSDPRFLLYILPALDKEEIIKSLSKFINPTGKSHLEAMHRILYDSNVSPSELMVALHQMEAKESDLLLKVIESIEYCMKQDIYKPENMGAALQQMVAMNPIPKLFLRTVIQTRSRFPKMVGFIVSNLLSPLVAKQVWTDEDLWKGFIKCCTLTTPDSFAVLASLPPARLESVFQSNLTEESFKDQFKSYCKSNGIKISF
eukprot:TRINITY_DN990_c1_g1_i1.p1 TRINITY_DN990_c1_g1~~TRINITY_DN990_c1_g1_i1.p1  ORF type:complete len:977 (-),score=387.51 TRINITY_DN990_c1_g1_i1:66-2960(-)